MPPSKEAEAFLRDVFDVSKAMDVMGGDKELLKEVGGMFLDSLPGDMARIKSGIANNDAKEVEQVAHSLKGAVGNFGAKRSYKAALKLHPHSVAALNNLGLIYTEQKQFGAAIEVFEQAIDQNKNYKKSYNNLGIALCAQGEADQAIEKFQKALVIDPDYQKAKKNLGAALSGRCKSVMPRRYNNN